MIIKTITVRTSFVVLIVETVDTFEGLKYCGILTVRYQGNVLGFENIEIEHFKRANLKNKVCNE